MLTGKRFGFLLWVWFFISLSLSAVQISTLPKQETSWGSCSSAHRKKPANGLQALAQSTLKPAWLIRDLLLHGLHLSPPLTSCEEQRILDLWQSLTFASVRNEPQKTSNQCCVAQANSGLCLVWLPWFTEVGVTLQKHISLVNAYPNMGTGYRIWLCPKTVKIWESTKFSSTLQNESAKVRPCALHKHQNVRAERRCSLLGSDSPQWPRGSQTTMVTYRKGSGR